VGLDPRRKALLGIGRDALPALVGLVEVTSIASITSTYRWPWGPGSRARLNLGTVKASGNHGDTQLVLEFLVNHLPKDDVGLFMSALTNNGRRLMNFVQGHIQATSDIQEDAAGPVNGGFFQQGTRNRLVGGLDGTIVTMRHTGPHD